LSSLVVKDSVENLTDDETDWREGCASLVMYLLQL
jgi:hypothetical protein